MTTDLLGQPHSDETLRILAVYDQLKALVVDDLPPFVTANLKDALASVSIVVTGLTADYENLLDLGV